MQHCDGVAEAFDEAPDDLRGERDLGYQHDRTATLLERGCGGAQVHLGLAGAGDAVQQPLLAAALAQRGDHGREHRLLVECQLGRVRASHAHGQMLRARDGAALASAQPARGAGRQHQAERAGKRGAVLGGDPFGQRHEV